MNGSIVGGVYWVEKGHMEPEAMGGQASDSICHGVLTVSHCSAGRVHRVSSGFPVTIQMLCLYEVYFGSMMTLFLKPRAQDGTDLVILNVLKELQMRARKSLIALQ